MIEKTQKYGRKFLQYSKYLKNNTNHLLYKVFYIIILISLSILISINNNNDNELNLYLHKEIEKEVEKIEPYQGKFTLGDVKKDFEKIVNKYKYLIKTEKNISEDSPIWMMWYQGLESAPPIILSCIQSVIQNREKHPVIIITKYNIDKYIKLPYYIMEKFKNKKFSLTHFSVYVRIALLFKYGGYWIDATYFVNTPITKIDASFYTLKLDFCFIKGHPFLKCIWSINYMAYTKNSFIAAFAYYAFLLYWKKYSYLVNYVLIDYVWHIAYTNIPEFKNIFNKIPTVYCNIFLLNKKLKAEYNKTDICYFNKLSKGFRYQHNKNSTNNTNSHYNYLIEHYKFDLKNINHNYIS